MLKGLILIALFLNVAFAKDRFSEADKKRFLDEVKQEIAQHKIENKGKVDLQIIKPGFYAELEEAFKQEKLTREEVTKIKQDFEEFSREHIDADKVEAAFYEFIEKELNTVSSKALEKIKEGGICNSWSCADGLKCAADPNQKVTDSKFKAMGATCTENAECASNACSLESPSSKKKVCEKIYRCYKPVALGESCAMNPVCATGVCLPYNSMTSGIGECVVKGKACKKTSECCSNLCSQNICKENIICKDCISTGGKPQRGQKCCEGLYLNGSGMCVPDVPPTVIPQVYVSPKKTLFLAFRRFFLAEAMAEDMGAGAKDDGYTIKSGLEADRDKYSTFTPTSSTETKSVDVTTASPSLTYGNKSNFETCDMNFRDDYFNGLKEKNLFALEIAMLGFDFVSTGDADNDYWLEGTGPDTSIYGRLKKIGQAHMVNRKDLNTRIAEADRQLTCACLDVKGLDQITDATKKKYFIENCEEYQKYVDPTKASYEDLNGDASGIKYKHMITTWTSKLAEFYQVLDVDNTTATSDLAKLQTWASSSAKWSETRTKSYDLFKFSIKNPSSSSAALGALVGALLAAGVIAVLGGFATTSILTGWTIAGIITASAATGAGGLWMIAALKGAWISVRPQITDNYIAPRSYSCGKKETCMEYTRTLIQPYNEICNIHASANACLKSFVAINEDNEPRYIVDPWIPAGVSKAAILKNQDNYKDQLEKGFEAAKSLMVNKNPTAQGGYVTDAYLSDVFIDEKVIGKYLPINTTNLESTYFMSSDKVKLIKDAAKAFAISENFISSGDTDNLNAFADYVYDYHFIYPKKSRPGEISYPTLGILTYLNYLANNVSGSLSTGITDATKAINSLNEKHLQDYLDTLNAFKDKAVTQLSAVQSTALDKEISSVKQKLSSVITMNALANNLALDSSLGKIDNSMIQTQAKTSGVSGTVSLNSNQTGFLKAIGTLRTLRSTQLKALDTYNKAMASSGDTDRTAKMAAASKSFSSKFSSGKSAIGASSSGALSSGADAKKDATATSSSNNGGYVSPYSGSGNSSGSSSAKASLPATPTDTSSTENADQSRIAEAIHARNQDKNANKYQSTDESSLFQKITNAYIRNYDKVLTKKKDKDLIEQK
jgi:hypothetical protein